MPTYEAIHCRSIFSTAGVVQIVEGTSKKYVFVGSDQLLIPEFVDIQDVL
jgi:hypothetical protein